MEPETQKTLSAAVTEAEENDIGVVEMKKALKAQEEFENAMDRGEFNLKDMTLIRRFLGYLKPYYGKFAFAVFLDIVITLGFTLTPMIEGDLINYLTGEGNLIQSLFGLGAELSMTGVAIYCVVYALVIVCVLFAMYFNGIIFYTIGQNVVTDIRNDLFAHVESLSIAQINALPVGKYITRITNDCRGLSLFFTDMIVNFMRDLLSIAMTMIIAFFLSWKLALVFVGFLPIVFFVSFFFRRATKKYFRAQRRQRSEINGFLSESIYGMRTIKVFDRENEKSKEFAEKNDALRKSYIRQVNIFSFYRPLMYFLQMAAVVIVLSVGVYFILGQDLVPFSDHTFGAGNLFTFYSYTTNFFQPVQDMAELMNSLQNVLTSAERVGALMSVSPSVEDAKDAKPLAEWEKLSPIAKAYPNIASEIKGDIEFRHVWFAYVGEEWVLKDVSFHVRPGKTAAFVGATGAGKSTIIGLIVRNMIPQKGDIFIDGINVKDITIESLRANVSQMMQDVFLFSGTIADNICLFDKNADMDRIRKSAITVGAEPFILSIPDGYQSVVRERGNNFSVGQKQLISFARAVYHKPSVMVLDEATANIDTETEELIQKSLKAMRSLGTMVIVAHRLSTIQDADCIYVVEKGRIVEEGKHDQLLKNHGVYYAMFKLQSLERDLNRPEQPAKA